MSSSIESYNLTEKIAQWKFWLYAAMIFILFVFILSIIGTLIEDIPCVTTYMSVSDLWVAFGALSTPLTISLFILNYYIKNLEKKLDKRNYIFSVVKVFLDDLDIFTENLTSTLSFDVGIFEGLNEEGKVIELL